MALSKVERIVVSKECQVRNTALVCTYNFLTLGGDLEGKFKCSGNIFLTRATCFAGPGSVAAGSRPQQYRGGPQGYPPQGGQQGYAGQYPGPGQVQIRTNLHTSRNPCTLFLLS